MRGQHAHRVAAAAHRRVATPEGGERIESSGFLGEGWKSGNLGLCRAADGGAAAGVRVTQGRSRGRGVRGQHFAGSDGSGMI
jgi:hypothetical protein